MTEPYATDDDPAGVDEHAPTASDGPIPGGDRPAAVAPPADVAPELHEGSDR